MTHPAVQRARELAADNWVENDSSFRNALTELASAYETLEASLRDAKAECEHLRALADDLSRGPR